MTSKAPALSSLVLGLCLRLLIPADASAQSPPIAGRVVDETGTALPGVTVELRSAPAGVRYATTDAEGHYRFDAVAAGAARLAFSLVQFASSRRDVVIPDRGTLRVDAIMRLALDADVTVTGKSTFTNLADVENPSQSLVRIARSESQGAVTARQLETRPRLRPAEVLETVPGAAITQHSGEGKANQYYLRGFNLDHGTDFATQVAGMPVNMPTHGHGHGYSDLSFLIPELVSGVQFSKGPYFADQGDFATAGAATINYVNALPRSVATVTGGSHGFVRALGAASTSAGPGTILAALEVQHDDGPWDRADDYRKVNGVLRYSVGDTVNGVAFTLMGYRGSWNATDQIPARGVAEGRVGRFGTIDQTDGGDSYRYSGSLEWQRTRDNASLSAAAFGIAYDLNLFSNFTYFLDDPDRGDQFQQTDRRVVTGGRIAYRRAGRWRSRPVQNTFGLPAVTSSAASACIAPTRGNASPPSARMACCRRAQAHTRRTRRNGSRGFARWRVCVWTDTDSA